jgi:hypothetical protein
MNGRWPQNVRRFLFRPQSDDWIALLRVGLGVLVTLYCLALRRDWNELFGGTGTGLLSRQLAELLASADSPLIPRLGWIVDGARAVGIAEKDALRFAWILLLTSGVSLVAGLCSRTSAILAWFLHLCAAKSGGLLSYGLDNLMTIGLFYLMCAPLPDRFTVDRRWRVHADLNGELVGFFRRMLQLHLCVIYFFGGLTKALGSGWWNGMNLWQALTREPFNVIPPDQIARLAGVLPALGICVWIVELAYPLFIWLRLTRQTWLLLTCAMHLGIGLAMGMHLFGFVMIVLNVAAFGSLSRVTQRVTSPATAK